MEDTRYDRLIEALATIPPCPFTGGVDANGIKLVLGEVGDIWPARVEAVTAAAIAADLALAPAAGTDDDHLLRLLD